MLCVQLPDTVEVTDEAVAADTQHIRLSVLHEVSGATDVNLYSFFEDSLLFHHLHNAWIQGRCREALSFPYELPRASVLRKLSRSSCQVLFDDLSSDIFAGKGLTKFDWKIHVMEELACAVGNSTLMKDMFFQHNEVLATLGSEVETQRQAIAPFLAAEDVDSVALSTLPHVLRDTIQRIRYVTTVYTCLSKLISGSAFVKSRLNFLKPRQPWSLRALFDSLLLVPRVELGEGSAAIAKLRRIQSGVDMRGRGGDDEDDEDEENGDGDDRQARKPKQPPSQEVVSRLKSALWEFDHAQMEFMFNLFEILEFSMANKGDVAVSAEDLFQVLITKERFVEVRLPLLFSRMADLMYNMRDDERAAYVYFEAYVIRRLISRDSASRRSVFSSNKVEIKSQLSREELTKVSEAMPHSFFVARAVSEIYTIRSELSNL